MFRKHIIDNKTWTVKGKSGNDVLSKTSSADKRMFSTIAMESQRLKET